MNDQQRKEHQVLGRSLAILSVLTFLYMGALSAALEGWELMFTICAWAGMSLLTACALGMTVTLVKELRHSNTDEA